MGWFRRRERHDNTTSSTAGTSGPGVLVIDFETSGLSPDQGARVTWLGAVGLTPDGTMNPYSMAVYGTDGMGVFGDPPASVQRVARDGMVDWLATVAGRVEAFVAHNATFDERFARAEFDATRRKFPKTPWLDTLQLARALRPGWPDYKLHTCCRMLGIPEPADHDALADATACAQVLQQLRMTETGGMLTIRELQDISAKQQREWAEGRGGRNSGMTITFDLDVHIEEGPDGRLRVVGPEFPMCGDLYEKDITDPVHLAAHRAYDDLGFDATIDDRIAALNGLVAAGCPTVAEEWAMLPYKYDGGGKGEFEGAMFVLGQLRDRDFATRNAILTASRALVYGPVNLADYGKYMLKAWRAYGPWLATYAPCDTCIETGYDCEHLDLAMASARAHEEHVDGWLHLVSTHGVEAVLTDPTLAKQIPAGRPRDALTALHAFTGTAPNAEARLVTALGQRLEKAGDLDQARAAFDMAIATGQAPVVAYDRLSLMLERAKEFPDATAVARAGVARAEQLKRSSDVLAKRADRCQAKAAKA